MEDDLSSLIQKLSGSNLTKVAEPFTNNHFARVKDVHCSLWPLLTEVRHALSPSHRTLSIVEATMSYE
ncbi:hypothetical protein J6590_011824 [Homalodisca vitripennis]|nr:hypothetical protein J6590_011824 [Homalodisca vitripennis]